MKKRWLWIHGMNRALPLRRRRGQGPPLAKRWEPRGFSRVAAGFSSYDGGDPPFVPSKRLPDWASLELSPSVESCGCGLGPAQSGLWLVPVRGAFSELLSHSKYKEQY